MELSKDPYIVGNDYKYNQLVFELYQKLKKEDFECFLDSIDKQKGIFKHFHNISHFYETKIGDIRLEQWLEKYNRIWVTENIIGIPFVAYYRNGVFFLGTTRNNGRYGTNITDRLKPLLPATVPKRELTAVYGKIALNNYEKEIKKINKKLNSFLFGGNIEAKVYAFQILNSKEPIDNQYKQLQVYFFNTAKTHIFVVDDGIKTILKKEYKEWKEDKKYNINGLILSKTNYLFDSSFFPKDIISIKF